MKYLSIIGLTAFMLLFAASCKKDEAKVVMNNNKPALSASVTTPLVLQQEQSDQQALTLTYDDIDLGFKDALTYTLQISIAGQNFQSDSLVEVDLDRKALSKKLTGQELNSLLLKEFSPAGTTRNYEFRIRTSAGNVYSNSVPLTITTYEDWPKVLPYNSAPDQLLYIPGDYQGWAPDAAAVAKVYSAKSDKKYAGTIVLPDATKGFKITPASNWTNSYGMTSVAMDGATAKGELKLNGGGNFAFAGSGTFTLTVDLTTNKWEAAPSTWSIIGDAAIDWNTDVDLEFDPATQTFFKVLPMKAGQWKFRKNHAWAGGDFPGSNLVITAAGTYKVLLDMRIPSEPYWKVIKQ